MIFLRPDPSTRWMDDAECRHDHEAWKFHQSTVDDPAADRRAKEVCKRCPVTASCLTYAITEFSSASGIWGGTNEADRTRLSRRRKPV